MKGHVKELSKSRKYDELVFLFPFDVKRIGGKRESELRLGEDWCPLAYNELMENSIKRTG